MSIEDVWSGDLLNRKDEAKLVYNFLINRHEERIRASESGSYVLNLTSSWGSGKTFFIKGLVGDVEALGHPTCYINAWADDNSSIPLISVMSSIDDTLKKHLSSDKILLDFWSKAKVTGARLVVSALTGAVKNIGKKFVGDEVENLAEIISKSGSETKELSINSEGAIDDASAALKRYLTAEISKYQEKLSSVKNFKAQMAALLIKADESDKVKLPMFIMIDELDRCRPTYSIELLEQVKHLFDINDIIFIVSSDTQQLAHSVNAIYGNNFDSLSYLRRFFARSYKLKEPSLERYVGYLFDKYYIDTEKLSSPNDMDHAEFFSGALKFFDISLRDAQQCFDILRTFVSTWTLSIKIELIVLVPMIVFHQRNEYRSHEEFFSGKLKLNGTDENLIYTETRYDSTDRSRKRYKMNMQGLVMNFVARSSDDLVAISMNPRRGSDAESWIDRRFTQEFNILHAGRYTEGNPPMSVVREYSKMLMDLNGFEMLSS